MSALLIRQMFRTADEEEVELELDTSVVEDRGKEKEIKEKKGVLGQTIVRVAHRAYAKGPRETNV